ncbi:MAG: hypothetical protein IAG10_17420 [Planctomycetaceae bacterium]|nr:hypothetical protein [Planctomycetaceae bacterium]
MPKSSAIERLSLVSRMSLFALLVLCGLSGCATMPYAYGSAQRYRTSPELEARNGQQIERGQPNTVLDSVGWVWGIPDKIILWDRRIENHRIGSQTESAIEDYLAKNELTSVKVRLNQYHPGDDWRRLAANDSVGAGWRYTLGTLSVLGETILPGRVFGGDHFNPFTNTIHVYSDVPAVAVHEAGHSKDFAQREWKGTYAAVYLLPGVPLYHEAKATNDALGYLLTESDEQTQRDAYEILYPAYGTYVGGALGGVFTGYGTYVASVLGGHALGRFKSEQIANGTLPESVPAPSRRDADIQATVSREDHDGQAIERIGVDFP